MNTSIEKSYVNLLKQVVTLPSSAQIDPLQSLTKLKNECIASLSRFTADATPEGKLLFLNKKQRLECTDYFSELDHVLEAIDKVLVRNGPKKLVDLLTNLLNTLNTFNENMAKANNKADAWFADTLSRQKQIQSKQGNFKLYKSAYLDSSLANPVDEAISSLNAVSEQLKTYLTNISTAWANKEQVNLLLTNAIDLLETASECNKTKEADDEKLKKWYDTANEKTELLKIKRFKSAYTDSSLVNSIDDAMDSLGEIRKQLKKYLVSESTAWTNKEQVDLLLEKAAKLRKTICASNKSDETVDEDLGEWYAQAVTRTKNIKEQVAANCKLPDALHAAIGSKSYQQAKASLDKLVTQLESLLEDPVCAVKTRDKIDLLILDAENQENALEKIKVQLSKEHENSAQEQYIRSLARKHMLNAFWIVLGLTASCFLYVWYLQWTGWCAIRFFACSMILPASVFLFIWKKIDKYSLNTAGNIGGGILICLDILQQIGSLIRGLISLFGKKDFGILDKLVPVTVGEFFAIMPHYLFAFGIFMCIFWIASEFQKSRNPLNTY